MIFQTINQFGEEFSVNKFQMLKCVQVSEPERAVVTPSSTIYQYNILICLSSLTIGYNFLFMMTLTMEYVLNKRKSLENYFKYSCSFNDRYMSQALQIYTTYNVFWSYHQGLTNRVIITKVKVRQVQVFIYKNKNMSTYLTFSHV